MAQGVCDLLVLAIRNGPKSLRQTLVHTVTEHVVEHAKCHCVVASLVLLMGDDDTDSMRVNKDLAKSYECIEKLQQRDMEEKGIGGSKIARIK